jgi:hypothetical protein
MTTRVDSITWFSPFGWLQVELGPVSLQVV